MKKILFATTALVATAGMAAAEVNFSGYGRFGAGENSAGTQGQYTRVRLQIDMTTEDASGVTYGARFRVQETKAVGGAVAAGGANFNAARVYMSTGGLTVAIGNIVGALEAMPNMYMNTQSASIGLSGLGFHSLAANTAANGYFNWDAYSSGGIGATNNQGVEVAYSMGDFGVWVSNSKVPGAGGRERTAAHVSYNWNGWTVAAGMQDSTAAGEDKTVVTVGGNIGPAGIQFGYADNNGINKMSLAGAFNVGADTRVDVYVTDEDGAAGGNAYGVALSHSLGNGVSFEVGYADASATTRTTAAEWDLGVRFNF